MRLSYYIRNFKNFIIYGKNCPKVRERIFVNPTKVNTVLSPQASFGRNSTGRIIDGNWDLQVMPLSELSKYQICENHFVHGMSWEQAGAFALMAKQFAIETRPDGCSTLDDVYKRYKKLDELYQYLKNGGKFKTKTEIEGNMWNKGEEGGVYIHIDRNGNPIFGGGGCHRMAIAKILKLNPIPAQLGVVHADAVYIVPKLRNLGLLL